MWLHQSIRSKWGIVCFLCNSISSVVRSITFPDYLRKYQSHRTEAYRDYSTKVQKLFEWKCLLYYPILPYKIARISLHQLRITCIICLFKMFLTLCTQMKHDLKNLPTNQSIIVQESDNADGSFLIYHFLSLFLRSPSNAKVYIVSCRNAATHFNTVLSKLGVQFNRCVDQNRCKIFDLMNYFRRENFKLDIQKLIEMIKIDFAAFSDQVNVPILFVIDDLSVLFDIGVSIDEAYQFFHFTRFSATKKDACFLISLSTYEDDRLAEKYQKFANIIKYYADYTLKVEKLKTGLSKEVSGTLSLTDNSENIKVRPSVIKLLYRLMDRNVTFSAPGMLPSV